MDVKEIEERYAPGKAVGVHIANFTQAIKDITFLLAALRQQEAEIAEIKRQRDLCLKSIEQDEGELEHLHEEIACFEAMKEGVQIRIGDLEEKIATLSEQDKVWREKKAVLENDLAKAWEEIATLKKSLEFETNNHLSYKDMVHDFLKRIPAMKQEIAALRREREKDVKLAVRQADRIERQFEEIETLRRELDETKLRREETVMACEILTQDMEGLRREVEWFRQRNEEFGYVLGNYERVKYEEKIHAALAKGE